MTENKFSAKKVMTDLSSGKTKFDFILHQVMILVGNVSCQPRFGNMDMEKAGRK